MNVPTVWNSNLTVPCRRSRKASRNVCRLGAVSVGCCLLPLASVLHAQSNDAKYAALEEIIVTAQKRDQKLEDVPISVAVMTSEDIDAQRIGAISDLGSALPNVSYTTTGSKEDPPILAIRGVGNNFNVRLPRVAIIVDDVPHMTLRGLDSALFDVEQIELLRGPQSTLFGLTAESGVINIRSVQPGDSMRAKLMAQVAEFGENEALASLSGPLVAERLSAGIALSGQWYDGYIENKFRNEKLDQGQTLSGRANLRFTPTENIEALIVYGRQEVDDDFDYASTPVNPTAFSQNYAVPPVGKRETSINNASSLDVLQQEAGLTLRMRFADLELVAASGYTTVSAQRLFDIDQGPIDVPFGPIVVSTAFFDDDTSNFTQELRLANRTEGRFNWVTGLFYYDRSFKERSRLNSDVGPITFAIGEDSTTSYAGFGQGEFHFNERSSLLGGLRYERTEGEGTLFSSLVLGPAFDNLTGSKDSSVVLPKLTATFGLSDTFKSYVTFSTGWLPGGVNANLGTLSGLTYEKETLRNVEVGLKGAAVDNRVRFNAGVFATSIDSYQESVRVTEFSSTLANITRCAGASGSDDDVEVWGADLDVSASLGANLQLALGAGFNEAKFGDDACAGITPLGGKRVPSIPDWDLSLAATYTFTSGWYARADYSATGDLYITEDRLNVFPKLDGRRVLNLTVGYDNDDWSVLAFVNNVTDDYYFTTAVDFIGFGDTRNQFGVVGHPGVPRQVGVRLTRRF